MIKNVGKALPYVLMGTIALSTLTGCTDRSITKQKKEDNYNKYENETVLDDEDNTEIKYDEALSNNGVELNDKESLNTNVTESPVVSSDVYSHLESVYKETNSLNPFSIIDMNNATSEMQASALYNYLKSNEIDLDEAKKELDNVVAAASVNLSDFTSYNELLFKNLSKTIGEDKNVWQFYYPLAEYIHLYNCTEEHSYNEFGYITCPVIEEKVDELNNNEFFTGYVIADVSDMSEDFPEYQAMERILKSKVDLNKAFKELETVFIVCAVQTDYSVEEWNEMFSELLKTVDERENVCEVYYDLAVLYHGLNCDEEHYLNENDKVVCKKYEKYYK